VCYGLGALYRLPFTFKGTSVKPLLADL